MKRQIWIVSEGSPGHISQSVGLAEALAATEPMNVERIECRPRLGGFARKLVQRWMGGKGRPLPAWLLKRAGLDVATLPTGKPDLIVSSGGKSVFAARTLAVRYGAPYVFLGERKPYPSAWFHTAFTPSKFETGENDVAIDMIPTQVTRAKVEQAAAGWPERPPGKLWAALIGGASVSHRYTPDDWRAMALAMNDVAHREGIRWLVTTSRRTGADVEARLRETLDPSIVAEAVWWSERPEKKMSRYLGAAEHLLVTQDSVTMVSEAIDSGRPVIVVRPGETRFSPRSFLPGYFDRLEQTGRMRRALMTGLSDWPVMSPVPESATTAAAEIAIKLRTRLGWD
ncbi:MAG TPA: ELM1/GtrOC1 family putative glycosyltransferase [Luteolibacter sp.]